MNSRHVMVIAAVVAAAGLTPPVFAEFVPAGDQTTTRSIAAVALADGKVLLAGGTIYAGFCLPLSSSERFDPSTDTFSGSADLNQTRCGARAVSLAGGVLVVGGFGEGLSSAETYDPTADQFTPTGPLQFSRGDGFTLTRLDDGRVLVAGGVTASGVTAMAEIFDPVSRTFTGTGPMSSPRAYHSAARLPDGRVLIAGGDSGADCASTAQSAEIFDPVTGAFSPAPVTAEPVWGAVSATLPDGRVLIAGGEPSCGVSLDGTASAQVFDPSGGQFFRLPDMLAAHGLGAGASLLPGGRVLITGGLAGSGPVDAAETFNPATGSFGQLTFMSTPRARHAQAALPDGRVLISGGESGPFDTTASAELFVPASALAASVDVLPRVQNLSSRGRFVTVFTGLPDGDVSLVDPGSIRMAVDGRGELAPARTPRIVTDHDGDGLPDLMIKFSRAEYVALAAPGRTAVTVRGSLFDSTPFEGTAEVVFR